MIEQQARVISQDGAALQVEIGARSGCPACDAGQGCGAGLFGKLLNQKPVTIRLESSLNRAPGQTVMIGLPESLFLKLVMTLYGIPLVAGLAGAAVAVAISAKIGLDGARADLLVLAGALLVAVPLLKIRNRTLLPELGSKQIQIIDSSRPGAVCGRSGDQAVNEVK
ncbi:MAG: SoxR reducing system RseC family protein [Xanthomonadales bacterium]|nr:SoxR reducing system RseC family protein [Xanthomonadales bacterium]